MSFVYPWRDIVSGHVGTEVAFERAFGSRAIAQLILAAAFLSLLKVFNGNFVAATRLMLGHRAARAGPPVARARPRVARDPVGRHLAGRRPHRGRALLGDALLVPITEVGSLAAGVGWLSACVAWLLRVDDEPRWPAYAGAAVAVVFIAMKVLPFVPGSFTAAEWIALGGWLGLGLVFWSMKRPGQGLGGQRCGWTSRRLIVPCRPGLQARRDGGAEAPPYRRSASRVGRMP